MTITELLKTNADEIERFLDKLSDDQDEDYPSLSEAMRYSLLSGGKRIRPLLVRLFCEMYGGDIQLSRRFGAAIEMIHTYSLIHDDMPCMDNDDLRRGRPTNHKVFGEATAMLAGDALLTEAFRVASDECVPPEISIRAVRLLAEGAGARGMIGGQMIDLRGETERLDFNVLLHMHTKKTGALIEAACLLGCLASRITDCKDPRYQAAQKYARGIGLAFQIIDDRLDVIGSTEVLGKPVGSDAESQKTTFLTFMTPDQAYDYASDLTAQAKEAISMFSGSEYLINLADFLLTRKK